MGERWGRVRHLGELLAVAMGSAFVTWILAREAAASATTNPVEVWPLYPLGGLSALGLLAAFGLPFVDWLQTRHRRRLKSVKRAKNRRLKEGQELQAALAKIDPNDKQALRDFNRKAARWYDKAIRDEHRWRPRIRADYSVLGANHWRQRAEDMPSIRPYLDECVERVARFGKSSGL